MELYVHSEGNEDPDLVEVESSGTIRELVVVREGRDGQELIWAENGDEPLELDITFEAAGIAHRHHVHRGRCRRVRVLVRYGGDTRPHDFPPSATVARVFDWACGPLGFNLTPEQRAKHVLAVPGADHALDPGVHIGSLVSAGSCEVVLDLAPKERFEG
jgi:hypothetical protein